MIEVAAVGNSDRSEKRNTLVEVKEEVGRDTGPYSEDAEVTPREDCLTGLQVEKHKLPTSGISTNVVVATPSENQQQQNQGNMILQEPTRKSGVVTMHHHHSPTSLGGETGQSPVTAKQAHDLHLAMLQLQQLGTSTNNNNNNCNATVFGASMLNAAKTPINSLLPLLLHSRNATNTVQSFTNKIESFQQQEKQAPTKKANRKRKLDENQGDLSSEDGDSSGESAGHPTSTSIMTTMNRSKMKKQDSTGSVDPLTRRERKNNREKQRRSELNLMFDRLNQSLGLPQNVRLDKISILSTAIETIDTLKAQLSLQQQHHHHAAPNSNNASASAVTAISMLHANNNNN